MGSLWLIWLFGQSGWCHLFIVLVGLVDFVYFSLLVYFGLNDFGRSVRFGSVDACGAFANLVDDVDVVGLVDLVG